MTTEVLGGDKLVRLQPTHYCARCGTTYLCEGECEWCPGHVQLFELRAKPAEGCP